MSDEHRVYLVTPIFPDENEPRMTWWLQQNISTIIAVLPREFSHVYAGTRDHHEAFLRLLASQGWNAGAHKRSYLFSHAVESGIELGAMQNYLDRLCDETIAICDRNTLQILIPEVCGQASDGEVWVYSGQGRGACIKQIHSRQLQG